MTREPGNVPFTSVRAPGAMVASADQLATQAGMAVLARGGNAVDAAIATGAAIAITGPHLNGLGGDMFALVHTAGEVFALNGTGRAGSGADPAAMRADGLTEMPFRHDVRSVTVPGCVDGWCALHARFGRLPLAEVLTPAIALATDGFPASPLLVGSLDGLDEAGAAALADLVRQARRPGDLVRRPRAGDVLREVGEHGRDAFYRGAFGEGLIALGAGWFAAADLATPGADWVTPLRASAFGKVLHTMPPNSQGYLTLGAAAILDRLAESGAVPSDPDDPLWAHLTVEAATMAGFDRPLVLHEDADGAALVDAILARADRIDPSTASHLPHRSTTGDTTYLCTVDRERMAVSLIQSNASGFGSWVVEPRTGINLHNRGLGFTLETGHPAELGPGRRPPHTLCPALATEPDGRLAAVFGTMGGDAQPQILLQLATRLFLHGASPAAAVRAGRWALRGPVTGFDTWTAAEGPHVTVEGHAAAEWVAGLEARGHAVQVIAPFDSGAGHAHAIVVAADGSLSGAADPRSRIGSAAGL